MKSIIVLLIICNALLAQRQSYVLKDDERVIKAGTERYWRSDYIWILEGDLIIEKGARLEIAPGTMIKFRPNTDVSRTGKEKNKCEVIVLGELIAKGEPSLNKFITFTSDAEQGQERSSDWYGIVIYKNSAGANTQIKNVNIQYAYRGISCIGSSPYILNNRILYSGNSGIYLSKSNAIIESNQIQSNGFAGVEVRMNSKPKIYQNNIELNDYGIMVYDSSEPSLGNKTNNKGENGFKDNFQYDIYNASSKDIMAIKNKWGEETDETVIKSKIFDNSNQNKYGKVIFQPISSLTYAELQRQNVQEQISSDVAAVTPKSPTPNNRSQKSNTTKPNTTKNTAQSNQQKQDAVKKQDQSTTAKKEVTKPEVVAQVPQTKPSESEQKEETPAEAGPDYYQQSLENPFLTFALDPGSGKVIQKAIPEKGGAIQQLNIRGRVFFKLNIDIDGTVKSAQILRSDNKLLEESALEAAYKFKFQPGLVQGQAVIFTVNDVFVFR